MISPKNRRILALIILALSLGLLAWGLWPMAEAMRIVPLQPEDMQLPTPAALLPVALAWLV